MKIDWSNVGESLPKTCSHLLDEIRSSYDSAPNDPSAAVKAVDMLLLGKLSALRKRVDELRKEMAK